MPKPSNPTSAQIERMATRALDEARTIAAGRDPLHSLADQRQRLREAVATGLPLARLRKIIREETNIGVSTARLRDWLELPKRTRKSSPKTTKPTVASPEGRPRKSPPTPATVPAPTPTSATPPEPDSALLGEQLADLRQLASASGRAGVTAALRARSDDALAALRARADLPRDLDREALVARLTQWFCS